MTKIQTRLLAAAGCLAIATPQAAMAAQEPALPFESGQAIQYQCDGGESFAVQFDTVRGTSTAMVNFSDANKATDRASLLLVAGPTGSGARYSNDDAVLHTKGNEAMLQVPETAATRAFAAKNCRAIGAGMAGVLTQGAQKGAYRFDISLFYPGQYADANYAAAETVCFIAEDADFMALVPNGNGRMAQYFITHPGDLRETGPIRVGDVDASAGNRTYRGTFADDRTLDWRFAAPGMIDGTVAGMSGLSSIADDGGNRLGCLDGADYLYVGALDQKTVTVEMSDSGALTYREWPAGGTASLVHVDGGYVTYDEGRTEFHFFQEGGTLIRLVATETETMSPDDNFVRGPNVRREFTPRAYFIADQTTYSEKIDQLAPSVSLVLRSLETCNHLAGEYGEDPERNREISEAQDRYECLAVDDHYDFALAEAPEGSNLRKWLEVNRPIWR